VRDVTIRGNTLRNHQYGVVVIQAPRTLIEDNTLEQDPIVQGQNRPSGGGLYLTTIDGAANPSSVIVRNNRFFYDAFAWLGEGLVVAHGPGTYEVTDNVMRGAQRIFWCFHTAPCHITSARNQWRTWDDAGVFFDAQDPPTQTISDTGSMRLDS
jgi:hypothetical protein